MSLLSEIRDYAARTKTPLPSFGKAAVKDANFVDRLSRGSEPRPTTVQRVRQFMREHPNGLVLRKGRPVARVEQATAAGKLPPVVNRDPCPRCATRGDIGCEHGRAGVNW